MRLCFLTSTPLNVTEGSGTYTGISTLAGALSALGVDIQLVYSQSWLQPYTLRRWLFNRRLPERSFAGFDAIVSFDLDGFRLPAGPIPRFACIKGVIADELRFESGLTKRLLQIQADWERQSVQRADGIITTSEYSRNRIAQNYGRAPDIVVIPELIDLTKWRRLFSDTIRERRTDDREPAAFRLLTVCRFYPRKNLEVLLHAMARLSNSGPAFELRVVGSGPMNSAWRRAARKLEVERSVRFLGDLSQQDLANEYAQADLFCMPSKQEGFGIVLLEAMAAGLPIVASDSAAIPEVTPHALLLDPDQPERWASAIASLQREPVVREQIGQASLARVQHYDAPRVAQRLLDCIQARCSISTRA